MTEQKGRYDVAAWDLEIVAMSEHLNQTLQLLQRDFASLRFHSKSRLFVIFGGPLPQPLTEDERALLEQYKEQAVIRSYRCKRQKD